MFSDHEPSYPPIEIAEGEMLSLNDLRDRFVLTRPEKGLERVSLEFSVDDIGKFEVGTLTSDDIATAHGTDPRNVGIIMADRPELLISTARVLKEWQERRKVALHEIFLNAVGPINPEIPYELRASFGLPDGREASTAVKEGEDGILSLETFARPFHLEGFPVDIVALYSVDQYLKDLSVSVF